jgi:hypothetical protein
MTGREPDIEGEFGDIEGEFSVESGYCCRGCWKPLPVGSASCPHCGRVFELPTPDRRRVPPGYSPARAKVMAAVYRDRVTSEEMDRIRESMQPPRSSQPSSPRRRP